MWRLLAGATAFHYRCLLLGNAPCFDVKGFDVKRAISMNRES